MVNIWEGRKYLMLEHCRSPWYATKNGKDICLKHYFTLWGWSLALRIVKTGYKEEVVVKAINTFYKISHNLKNIFTGEEGKLEKGDYQKLYCYNGKGDFLGSLDDLAWMIHNNCIADHDLLGVAFCTEKHGYIGYSRRAKQLFKIGDKLFDAKYIPKEEDYEEWEWAGFVQDQIKNQSHSIVDNIPFTKRGTVTITTPEEAREAAHRFSDYIS